MRTFLSVGEHALFEFFGCLPVQQDDDMAWRYDDSVYEVANSGMHVSFAIAPAYRDVRILLTVASATLFEFNEFNAMGVEDVRVHSEKGLQSLEVCVTPTHSIWLSLTPQITLRQSVSSGVAR